VILFASALVSAPAYLESARAAGFSAEAEAIGERVRQGDLRGAVAEVSDEMAAAMVMAGSVERVRAKIDGYRAAGIGGVHLLPAPPGGFYPLYEDHFPVESLARLPEFDFPGLVGSFEQTIALLAQ
jgi:alkanesulfonate monooxygenase SsuD/methylene tetrahydromethanopterin reductase-like flavin-dependent oxidoreductase (luciferase family)